jgi:hypothetical protein
LLWLKHEAEFTWGAEQRDAYNNIKGYLSNPLVLRAPKSGLPFRLYIAAQEKVIGVVLAQEDGGKECIIAYVSHRLLDTESRYVFIEGFACLYIMHVPSLGIIFCLVLL